MQKKNGELIWVLDSDRKAKNSEGITKTNSIITDITPLKQAMFDLEVERERYQIALESVTDVMCEYDIQKDLYTAYQRIELEGKIEMEKFEINDFSKTIVKENMVHPEDINTIVDVFCG